MIHLNDPLLPQSLHHRYLVFFPQKTGSRQKIVLSSFPARWATLVGCVAETYWSSSSHQFNGIWVHWLCWLRHQFKDRLFLFTYNVPLAEFTSMIWVIILHEYKFLTYKPCSRCDCMMLQYAERADLIQFSLNLM